MDTLLIYLMFAWAVFALIGMFMASERGRNPLAGALSGAIFGLFALLYYLIAGDTVEMRVKKEAEAKVKLGL